MLLSLIRSPGDDKHCQCNNWLDLDITKFFRCHKWVLGSVRDVSNAYKFKTPYYVQPVVCCNKRHFGRVIGYVLIEN